MMAGILDIRKEGQEVLLKVLSPQKILIVSEYDRSYVVHAAGI